MTDWMDDADCRQYGPELWYADEDSPLTKSAITVCEDCPVKAQCLDAAMREETTAGRRGRWGVWGGLTASQRAALERTLKTCTQCGAKVPGKRGRAITCSKQCALERHAEQKRAAARTAYRRSARALHLIADPDDPRHGTITGVNAHRGAGVPICDKCRDARNALARERRRKGLAA